MIFADDDPIWERHTGGEKHRGQEWMQGDEGRAKRFYAAVTSGKTRFFLDMLMDRPGEQVSADEMWRRRPDLFGGPERPVTSNRLAVARALRDINPAWEASGRRYPFYWWAGHNGEPTMYGMKPMVAKLFREARG